MRKPPAKKAKKKPARRQCRCAGVNQRVNVVTGAGGGGGQPVVVPMFSPAPPQMPQFIFPHPADYGSPGEHIRRTRDNHQYEPNPGTGVDATPTQAHVGLDVTNEDITPFERARAQHRSMQTQTDVNDRPMMITKMTDSQLRDQITTEGLMTQQEARQIRSRKQLLQIVRMSRL